MPELDYLRKAINLVTHLSAPKLKYVILRLEAMKSKSVSEIEEDAENEGLKPIVIKAIQQIDSGKVIGRPVSQFLNEL